MKAKDAGNKQQAGNTWKCTLNDGTYGGQGSHDAQGSRRQGGAILPSLCARSLWRRLGAMPSRPTPYLMHLHQEGRHLQRQPPRPGGRSTLLTTARNCERAPSLDPPHRPLMLQTLRRLSAADLRRLTSRSGPRLTAPWGNDRMTFTPSPPHSKRVLRLRPHREWS